MIYCIATYCPLSKECGICKSQSPSDSHTYVNYSSNLIPRHARWECSKFEPKRYHLTDSLRR